MLNSNLENEEGKIQIFMLHSLCVNQKNPRSQISQTSLCIFHFFSEMQ